MVLFPRVSPDVVEELYDNSNAKLLGKGSFGSVYVVRQRQTGKEVAMKILKNRSSAFREVSILTQITPETGCRKHLACLIDAFQFDYDKGEYVIVTEFVKGFTLDRYVEKNGTLNATVARNLLRQSLEALEYIHRRAIVHNDIKGENIMVTTQGQSVLLDFGLGCLAMQRNSRYAALRRPVLCRSTEGGTPDFLSPDRVLLKTGKLAPNEERLFTILRSGDVFALGVSFYEAITGRRFPGVLNEAQDAVVYSSAPRFTLENGKDVEKIVQWMMHPRTSNRPTAAAALKFLN